MSRRKRSLVTTLDPAFVDLVEEYRVSVAGSVSDLEVAVKLEANGIGDSAASPTSSPASCRWRRPER